MQPINAHIFQVVPIDSMSVQSGRGTNKNKTQKLDFMKCKIFRYCSWKGQNIKPFCQKKAATRIENQ